MLPQLRRYLLDNWPDLALGGPRPGSLDFLVQATGIGKLCYFIFPNHAAEPWWVAKMRRTPAENDLLRREYALIKSLRQNGSDFVKDTIPAPLGEAVIAGHYLVIEPYLHGRAMDGLMANARARTPARTVSYLDLALGWLLRCQKETPLERGRLTDQQVNRYFVEPIAHLRSSARLTDGESGYLDRLVERVKRLARVPLPLVFKHGDFQPANVLLRDGSVHVIDWEFGVATALPLLDVFGFLQRTHARQQGREEMDGFLEDYLLDFETVFFGRDSIARESVDHLDRAARALEIDPAWVPVLFGMFLVTEANKYDALLRWRAERGYLYLLRSRSNQIAGSFSDQLARQKNIWLLGYLAQHEDRFAFAGCRPTATRSAEAPAPTNSVATSEALD